MAKPRIYHHNKPNISEGLGGGAIEAGGVEEEMGQADMGKRGRRGQHKKPPPPLQSQQQAENGPTVQKGGSFG